MKIISKITYLLLAVSSPSWAEDLDQGDLKMGVLGLEAVARSSSNDGASGGMSGHIGALVTQAPDGKNKYPLLFGQVDGNYNQVMGGNRGWSTGADLRGRLALGITPDGDLSNSCDVYFAMEGKADASVWYHHSEAGRASIGPETGLACQTGRTLFMFSPSVQAGFIYGNGEGAPFTGSDADSVDVSAPILYSLNFRLSTGETSPDCATKGCNSDKHRGYLTAEFQGAPVTEGVTPGKREVAIYDTQVTGGYEFAPRWLVNLRAGATIFDPDGARVLDDASTKTQHAGALAVGVEKAF
ncbi:MAG: hypothetical protein AAB425_13940 [Bdellovibrionota bacterium]